MIDTRRKVRQLYRSGMTQSDIARTMDISKQRVSQILLPWANGRIPVYKRGWATHRIHVRVLVRTPELMPGLENVSRKMVRGLQGRDRIRELVRIRDGHTCQGCKRVWELGTRRLDVHHLGGLCGRLSKRYDRVDDGNVLITLCHRCHYNHHQFRLDRVKGKYTKKGNFTQP
jgi:hypothetical protein